MLESDEKVIGERKQKIKNWLKDPYNLALIGVMVFAFVIRFYYFWLTKNQPLWWDEADYMNIARSWSGGKFWDFNVIRPVLFPIIGSFCYFLGSAEILMRLFVLFSSIISIFFIYLIGCILFKDRKIGLISAFILSIFWSFLFYSFRILIDVPLAMMWLVSIYFFLRAYKQDKGYWAYIFAGFLLGLSFLMKSPTIILFIAITIYLLISERTAIFKNIKIMAYYLSSLFVVLPYFIWQKINYGSYVAFYKVARGNTVLRRSFLQSTIDQIGFSLKLIDIVILICIILSFFWILFELFIGREKMLDKKSIYSSYLFILIWIICSLAFFGWVNYGDYMDERYYFVFYPAYFLLASILICTVYKVVAKYTKILSIGIIIVLLAFAAYTELKHANEIIHIKKESFIQLKNGGEWINQNSKETDKILILEEPAEIFYYANRDWEGWDNKTDFISKVANEDFKFIFLSFYYSLNSKYNSDDRIASIEYILSNLDKFKPVKIYEPYIDKQRTLPLAIILENNYGISSFNTSQFE